MKYILISFLVILVAISQTIVKGEVYLKGTGESVYGAQVQAKNKFIGTVTDSEGHFELTVDKTVRELVVSYVGYKAKTVKVSNKIIRVYLTENRYNSDEVIVTANRSESKRSDQALAISKIGVDKIESLKPQMLQEVVNKVSGVLMVDLGNEQHSMSIRQPMSYKAYFLYLEDGIPIRPMGIFNHNALIEMNMYGLESIEVVKGPSSSIYGPEAIGGAINFISKKPSFQNEMKYGSQVNDDGNLQVRYHQNYAVNETLGLTFNGYYSNQRNGFLDHSDYKKFSGSLRSDYYMNETDKITLTGNFNYLDTDMGSGTVNLDSFNKKNFFEPSYIR